MRFKSFIFVHLFSMTDSCLLICVHECLQYPHYPHMIIVTINRFISFFYFCPLLVFLCSSNNSPGPNIMLNSSVRFCKPVKSKFLANREILSIVELWNFAALEHIWIKLWIILIIFIKQKNSNFMRSYFLIFQLTFQRALEYIRHHLKWFIQPNICCPKVESVVRKRNKKWIQIMKMSYNSHRTQFKSMACLSIYSVFTHI